MAEKKWKLGELEFDTEQEYLNASKDLKKIKLIMQKYDITKPADAKAVLKEITDKLGSDKETSKSAAEKNNEVRRGFQVENTACL